VGWKHGFLDTAGQYKTRNRYKKTLAEEIQEQVKVQFMKIWNGKEKERAALVMIEQPTSPGFRSSVGSIQVDN
jgi:hypothetical protein